MAWVMGLSNLPPRCPAFDKSFHSGFINVPPAADGILCSYVADVYHIVRYFVLAYFE